MLLLRRAVLQTAALLVVQPRLPSYAADSDAALFARLSQPMLNSPGVSPNRDQPLLPSYLAGRWSCTQTLQQFTTPLGANFIGAPGRPPSEAEASAAETRRQIGKPVELELRFNAVDGGAIEDRAFNAGSRLDAFAGRKVTRSAEACEATGSLDVLAAQPVACTAVEFLGPVTQRILVNSQRVAAAPDGARIVSSEFQRSVFARRVQSDDKRNFPPIVTDSEVLLEVEAPKAGASDDRLVGRLRLASYLQPLDPLYFAADKKAVSISDYSVELRRIAS